MAKSRRSWRRRTGPAESFANFTVYVRHWVSLGTTVMVWVLALAQSGAESVVYDWHQVLQEVAHQLTPENAETTRARVLQLLDAPGQE